MTAIRLLRAWKVWPLGHVIPEMPEAQASALIGRGIAEVAREARSPVREIMSLGRRANYATKSTGKKG
jgi:hypothetical protein